MSNRRRLDVATRHEAACLSSGGLARDSLVTVFLRLVGVFLLLLVAPQSVAAGRHQADGGVSIPAAIKDSVVVVNPRFHDNTRALFQQLAQMFAETVQRSTDPQERHLLAALAQRYQQLSKSPGHGTGWFVRDPDGRNWVVTNKHVAGQASSVELEWDEARIPSLPDCPVVYVDPREDLAVIRVTHPLPPQVVGFKVSNRYIQEAQAVAAVGFPGIPGTTRNQAAYQYTEGIVNNARFPMPNGSRAIQHSASIDPGSSGGPLLYRVGSEVGLDVIGVNTWSVRQRTNVNLSIPASAAAHALDRARHAEALRRDISQLELALWETAAMLASELTSAQPNVEGLYNLISSRMVATRGPQLLSGMTTAQLGEFVAAHDPVEYLRELLFFAFVTEYHSEKIGSVAMRSVYQQDLQSLDTGGLVRSVFDVADQTHEIAWVFEHGSWKIGDATFQTQPASQVVAAVPDPGAAGPLTATSATAMPPPMAPVALARPDDSLARSGRLRRAGTVLTVLGAISAGVAVTGAVMGLQAELALSETRGAARMGAIDRGYAGNVLVVAGGIGTVMLPGGVTMMIIGRGRDQRAHTSMTWAPVPLRGGAAMTLGGSF